MNKLNHLKTDKNTIEQASQIAKQLKIGECVKLTFALDYSDYELYLLKNKIARLSGLRTDELEIGHTTEKISDANSDSEIVISSVWLIRKLRKPNNSLGSSLRERWIQWEIMAEITGPEPHEIPKFHL